MPRDFAAFNRVITQLMLDGRAYWVDSTETCQRDQLAAQHLRQLDEAGQLLGQVLSWQ